MRYNVGRCGTFELSQQATLTKVTALFSFPKWKHDANRLRTKTLIVNMGWPGAGGLGNACMYALRGGMVKARSYLPTTLKLANSCVLHVVLRLDFIETPPIHEF